MESIAKAYQALTDPLSRENFEKYGHPDGRQVNNDHILICLFMFTCYNSLFSSNCSEEIVSVSQKYLNENVKCD